MTGKLNFRTTFFNMFRLGKPINNGLSLTDTLSSFDASYNVILFYISVV